MQLSPSLSRRLVFAVGAASLAGCVTLLYARHVAGNPMRLFRDSEGVLRFETRRDVLESKMAEAQLALAAEPDSTARRYAASLAAHALSVERARLAASGATQDIKDEDLQ